jgi:hypothetical protein
MAMGEPKTPFQNEHQQPSRPPHLAVTPVTRAIRAIIGGLVGAVAGGLGGAVGTTVVLTGAVAWEGWNSWMPLIFVCFSIIPVFGGFVGGSFIGAMGARARGSVLGLAVGGVLGAWLEFIVVMLLTWYSEDHDLIDYPRAFVYLLFVLSGVLPPVLGSVLNFRIAGRIRSREDRRQHFP